MICHGFFPNQQAQSKKKRNEAIIKHQSLTKTIFSQRYKKIINFKKKKKKRRDHHHQTTTPIYDAHRDNNNNVK
jgi:hypothetical protein